MASPEISVVMGVYNGMPHLQQAVASILSQQDVDLEFIIVDDGSTDETPDLLAQLARQDPRLRVLRQTNAGLTQALIHGCEAARGLYIARQDSDDHSLPGRLRAQRDLLAQHPSLAFVSCWSEVVGPQGELLMEVKPAAEIRAATEALLQRVSGPAGHGSVMMKTAAYREVGGYRREFYYAQDSDLWLRLGQYAQFGFVPEILYRYQIDAASISGSRNTLKAPFAEAVTELFHARLAGRAEAPILERMKSFPVHAGASPSHRSTAYITHYFIGNRLLQRGDRRSVDYFHRALQQQPLYWRAWLKLPLALLLWLRSAVAR